MRLQLKGKQVNITAPLQKLVEQRLGRIERILNEALMSAHVVLSREKNRLVVDLTVHAKGDHTLHGLGSAATWGASLTGAVAKVMQQAEKMKGKWKVRKKGTATVRKLAVQDSTR
jgi:ribosomal subunit interface protein